MKSLSTRCSSSAPAGLHVMRGVSAVLSRAVSMPRSALLWLLTIAASVLWAVSLFLIRLDEMTDLGLVSVLPLPYALALGLLTLGFMLALRSRPLPKAILAADIVVLVMMLYGSLPIVAEELSFSTAWLHAGFAETISRTGELFQTRDARFSWPAFFVLAGYLTQIGGFANPVDIAPWSPLVLNLLLIGPLLLIFRSSTGDPRLIWLALWFFFSLNWVAQDYFSPQGFNFLLFVVIFGIVLTAFRSSVGRLGWLEWIQRRVGAIHEREEGGVADVLETELSPRLQPRARAGLVFLLAVLFVALTAGHQLTPFAALGAMIGLVLFGRTTLRLLPLIMLVILTTWLSYMTVVFLAGHLSGLLEDLGRTENVAASNVANRIRGSFDHQLVVYARLGFTGAVWLLAFLGGVRRLFNRHLELTIGLLALAPFGLIALQGYGGEMLLRVFLFSSPFMAFLAAALFVPHERREDMRWTTTGVLVIAGVLLLGGFHLARYGNASADYMSSDEVAAAAELYRIAPADSLIATVNHNAPLHEVRWEQFRYRTLQEEVITGDVDDVVAALNSTEARESYLYLSRSQQAFAQLFVGTDAATWRVILDSLRRAPELEVVIENDDALVLRLRNEVGRGS